MPIQCVSICGHWYVEPGGSRGCGKREEREERESFDPSTLRQVHLIQFVEFASMGSCSMTHDLLGQTFLREGEEHAFGGVQCWEIQMAAAESF